MGILTVDYKGLKKLIIDWDKLSTAAELFVLAALNFGLLAMSWALAGNDLVTLSKAFLGF